MPKYKKAAESLAVCRINFTFAAMIQLCVTYPIYKQGVNLMQRNLNFFASFHTDYLVNSNNLLTHTHTHRTVDQITL